MGSTYFATMDLFYHVTRSFNSVNTHTLRSALVLCEHSSVNTNLQLTGAIAWVSAPDIVNPRAFICVRNCTTLLCNFSTSSEDSDKIRNTCGAWITKSETLDSSCKSVATLRDNSCFCGHWTSSSQQCLTSRDAPATQGVMELENK